MKNAAPDVRSPFVFIGGKKFSKSGGCKRFPLDELVVDIPSSGHGKNFHPDWKLEVRILVFCWYSLARAPQCGPLDANSKNKAKRFFPRVEGPSNVFHTEVANVRA